MGLPEKVVEVEGVRTLFGDHCVHDGISLDVRRGEIMAIVGGSGSGKSVLLREIIMLHRPSAGRIRLFGEPVEAAWGAGAARLRRRFGVLFQHGALFSGLTVAENVGMPLAEHTDLPPEAIREVALLKIALVGLPAEAADRLPAQLSGGMLKRAAMARALALDPELLCLDEPSAGLDPVGAEALDSLILQLRDSLGLTVLMVTHDLDSLWRACDRAAFLGEGRLLGLGTPAELSAGGHPALAAYFHGPRGRRAEGVTWRRE